MNHLTPQILNNYLKPPRRSRSNRPYKNQDQQSSLLKIHQPPLLTKKYTDHNSNKKQKITYRSQLTNQDKYTQNLNLKSDYNTYSYMTNSQNSQQKSKFSNEENKKNKDKNYNQSPNQQIISLNHQYQISKPSKWEKYKNNFDPKEKYLYKKQYDSQNIRDKSLSDKKKDQVLNYAKNQNIFQKYSKNYQMDNLKQKYGLNTINKFNIVSLKKSKSSPKIKFKQMLSFTIGKQTYNFQKKMQLGKGAYGNVYFVEQMKTKTLYAMKVMSKVKIKQENNQQNIFRELKIQLFLDHPNIIKLYQYFQNQQNIYLLTQLMEQSLFQLKQKLTRFTEERTARTVEQICKGIIYLHSNDIMHRDLKLQNIMITNKVMKIGDFGCAVQTQDMRKTKIGSPAYYSPEQLRDSPYDFKVDVWSLGIITYQLIFGQTPFDRDILRIIRNEKKKQLSTLKFPIDKPISEDAKDFIMKLLEKDPTKRLNIQVALEHPFIIKNRKQMNQL